MSCRFALNVDDVLTAVIAPYVNHGCCANHNCPVNCSRCHFVVHMVFIPEFATEGLMIINQVPACIPISCSVRTIATVASSQLHCYLAVALFFLRFVH
jgi:hypothetical protein